MIRKLGVSSDTIYETVITTYGPNYSPHGAAMGTTFALHEGACEIRIRPHRTSETYRNLSAKGAGVVNVVHPLLLVECALDLGVVEVSYERAEFVEAPALRDAYLWIEFEVSSISDEGEWGRALCYPKGCKLRSPNPIIYSRGYAALVEAAVYASRIDVYRRLGDERRREEAWRFTEHYLSLAERVSREEVVRRIVEGIRAKYLRGDRPTY